jgi:hypothetical protein
LEFAVGGNFQRKTQQRKGRLVEKSEECML